MEFINNSWFRAGMTFFFVDELKGLKVKPILYKSNETSSTIYGNWTFPSR